MHTNPFFINKKPAVVLSLILFVIGIGIATWFLHHPLQQDAAPLFGEASELRELKEQWKTVIAEKGGEAAYALFLEEAPRLGLEPHNQAHAFGEALYETEGHDGLKACDSSFEFGCYHSFFGVAVHNEGIESLPKFAEACKTKYGSMNLPCEHGIGHGVLVYTDYENLEDALQLCETINAQPTGGCSSGVFMEYNFHTMEASTGGSYIREKTDNLYEPCDTLPDRFQASCYFEQVQWWQSTFGGDFEKIGELCSVLLPNSAQFYACYNGAGNYAAAQAGLDVEETQVLCSHMPSEETKGLCIEGASWLFAGDPTKSDAAQQLCEVLEEPYKSQCFQKLNYQL